ncbi:MAG: efflux RND transporter permease subunit [Planctomycetota bacterium]
MKISLFSVHRPIFIIMIVLIVIVLGSISLSRLPLDLMPDISYPTISISTEYSNAGSQEIEQLITRPIEEAMSAVPGVEEVSSVSVEGSSNIRVTFSWGTDLEAAANDIRDRMDRVTGRLPDEASRPFIRKFDPSSFPVLILGAAGNLDPIEMRNIIDNQVKYRIERIPGVASLDIRGGLEKEIHVNLNIDKVKALGLPIDQLISRIKAENINIPTGIITRGNLDITIRTPGEYTDLNQLQNTVVAMRESVPVRLIDIADVEDSWQKITRIVRVNGKNGTRLSVSKRSGANTVTVARAVLEEINRINADIPQIHFVPIIDSSDFIQRSINNVGNSAFYGGIFALLILLFFLRNIRGTIVIATAIPISIIATFILMYFNGFTLNILTLGGLALGIGMLVDNSIVVMENIYRLKETGSGAEESAVKGSEEVTAAIIASTLTTVAVFLPLIFVRGMAGVLFKQLSFVVSFSLFCSLLVALTLTPMLASKLLRIKRRSSLAGHKPQNIQRKNGIVPKIENSYKNLLHFALNHRTIVIIAAVVLLLGSTLLVRFIGIELMPTADEGQVTVNGEMIVGTNIELLNNKFTILEGMVKEYVPEAKHTVSSVGGGGWRSSGSHTGDITISLKPQSERNRSSEQIAADLRRKLSQMPGINIRTRASGGFFLMRIMSGGTEKVQVEIRGYDIETADELAKQVKQIVEKVEGVTDVLISRESGSPEERIITDRQKSADMKVTVSQIAQMLQTILSGTSAGYFREGGNEYKILVKLKDAEKMKLNDILDLSITNSEGQPVVLRNIVRTEPCSGPVRIERKGRERLITVSANISGRDMGSILSDIRERLRSITLPRDFSIVFGGEYEEQQKAFKELLLSLILSIVLVYMVMASLYESLRDPFIVMFSVPLAAIGVILILFLTNTTFNIQSFIGCIMLGGIVVNNAILLVDHINLLRRRDNMPLREAIEEAGRRRLRPILMTTLTTIMGLVPLAIGLGEGGEAQAPMARVVIGGLLSSTLITLVFVPTIYSLFENRRTIKKEQVK